MEISVIIPSYNGAHKLPNIINAIRSQTILPKEVIIVVDGSTDNTADMLKAANLPAYFHVIFRKNGGRSIVRNSGASVATGDLLVFFDDDMLPEQNCLEAHCVHHQNFPQSIMTGAVIDSVTDSSSDFQKFRSKLSRKWSEPLIALEGKPLDDKHVFITAANFSIPKALFFALSGFNEDLKDSEDFDLAVRAFRMGIPLHYNHNAFAFHNDPMTCQKYVNRLREYTRSQHNLQSISTGELQMLQRYLTPALSGFKKWVFRFFAGNFWIRTIDNFNWLLTLPRALRYKIYDLVITANGVYFIDTKFTSH